MLHQSADVGGSGTDNTKFFISIAMRNTSDRKIVLAYRFWPFILAFSSSRSTHRRTVGTGTGDANFFITGEIGGSWA
jgi:hypothetical protein